MKRLSSARSMGGCADDGGEDADDVDGDVGYCCGCLRCACADELHKNEVDDGDKSELCAGSLDPLLS